VQRASHSPTLWDPLANWTSFIRWSPDPVSHRSVTLLCSVLCLYGSREIQFSFMVVMCKRKTYTNHAGENYPTQHVRLEIQFPN
jgi:hypothetical protein